MRLQDLVSMDAEGDFRSDVQLSDFENPTLNKELLTHYIFTVNAPATFGAAQRDYAAKDVLEVLKTAFTISRGDYRIVLTANYGRGKSHLALTLANFFARPSDSEEVKIVLNRLQQALNNPSQLGGYRDFKKERGEFLVVRLQGDAFSDLQEGFVRALEQALSEHDSTRHIALPFWYRHAEDWFNQLNSEARQKADAFLAAQKTDLPSLQAGLRRPGAYELVRGVVKHITGMYPDFGREINLEELVLWAVDQVCLPNQLGGLLVLFDEFSLFLRNYTGALSVGKLQELLNGINKRPGKSVFLAFSQQDVDAVAETYAQGQRRDDVKKELERLPKDKRARLYSLMESVLDSYLKQDDAQWETWHAQPPVKAALVQAREIVLEHFGKHYSNELQWNPQAFEEKVVKGCFPLHPLTTAILAVHNFESGSAENQRTALEFVRLAWQNLRQESTQLPDGRPNFVFPIALVEFFGEQLSKKWHLAYRTAVETAPQALSDEQRKVLQALLLQQSVGLKAVGGDQLDLLQHLSGLGKEDVKQILRELTTQKSINFDPVNKYSSLWPASIRPQEVEDVILKAIAATPVDSTLMDKITSALQPLEISSLNFGHANDWQPTQVAITTAMFTVAELKKLLQPYRKHEIIGLQEGFRGLVVWLLAESEEEKIGLRQSAQKILDEAILDINQPLPIVIVLPKQAVPSLTAFAQRTKALESLKNTEREKIGTVMYQQELGMADLNFKSALDDFVGGTRGFDEIQRQLIEYVLPATYRASVQALKNLSLKSVVTECYRQAYAYRVEFFTNFQVGGKGQNHLRSATQSVSRWLFSDTAGSSIRNLGNKDTQYPLANIYLTQKWGLLTAETYSIQRPTNRALQHAWDLLEETFKPGVSEVPVLPVVLTLLNPPYGHDYNTLTLLLAAWIGFHQHELRLFLKGQIVTLSQFKSFFDEAKNPQDFLLRIASLQPLAISRSQPDELLGKINDLLEQIRQGKNFTKAEAQESLAKLEQVLANPRLPDAAREEVEHIQPRLQEAFSKAQEYDQKVSAWLAQLGADSFDELLKMRDFQDDFPHLSIVLATQPSLEDLQSRWLRAMQTALDTLCERYARLSTLADYKTHEHQLKQAHKSLAQYAQFAKQVEGALRKLNERYSELEKQQREIPIRVQIKSMTASASLSTLYAYCDELEGLSDLSPETATLRSSKQREIKSRIQQYEQVVKELPQAIERATQLSEVRQQKELLLRNLQAVQETPLAKVLLEFQEKASQLEAFFEDAREVEALPRSTPDEMSTYETRVNELEMKYLVWLSPAQKTLLDKKKENAGNARRQKTAEAQAWLQDLGQRYKNGESPEGLIRKINLPHAFLAPEDLTRLEQLKQLLITRQDQSTLGKIEALFLSINEIETRRQCVAHLQELLETKNEH